MHVLSLASNDLHGFFHQWYAWHTAGVLRDDAVLHYVWQCQQAPTLEAITQQGKRFAQTLANQQAQSWFENRLRQLQKQWWGILAGWNRLALDEERLILTVVVDTPLSTLQAATGSFAHMVLHSDFFTAQAKNTAAGIKKLCHWHTQLHYVDVVDTSARTQWNAALQSSGWLHPKHPLPPCPTANTQTHTWQQAIYAPHWHQTKKPTPAPQKPQKAAVIGAGLSGAAVAYSLARRGWQVEVFDTHHTPAGGASGLPVGLVVPHTSKDDTKISQISRAGVRCTLQRAQQLLQAGTNWAHTGVLEHCTDGRIKLPIHWHTQTHAQDWAMPADTQHTTQAMLPSNASAVWHACGAWIQPAKLVTALLAHPHITFHGNQHISQLQAIPHTQHTAWNILDATHHVLAQADIVVIAAAYGSQALLQASHPNHAAYGISLNPLRGQVAWQWHQASDTALPHIPVNGKGSMAAHIPFEYEGKQGTIWISGSTFTRGDTDASPRHSDMPTLYDKLSILHPNAAQHLQVDWKTNPPNAWAGMRATLPDRMPAVGSPLAQAENGLYLCCGMGARGLTLAMLCGEHLAAQLNHEPSTLPKPLARMLKASRWNDKN